MPLRGLFAEQPVRVWRGYEHSIQNGKIRLPAEPAGEDDPYPGRFLNQHKKVPEFCRVLKHAGLLRWIRLLMEREPKPLQTIASHKGSQQGVHSDSIHMTTYPLGYLSAAWIACEDIHAGSGPLVFYPGSHRLPFIFSKDVGISEADFRRDGYRSYQEKYEPHILRVIEEHGLEPRYFQARKNNPLNSSPSASPPTKRRPLTPSASPMHSPKPAFPINW